MRYIVFILLIVCGLTTSGQTVKKKIPSKNGITHHTINENKIQLMKDANFALEEIRKFQSKKILSYGLIGLGAGLTYYAMDHMDTPVKYPGYDKDRYDRQKRERLTVGIIGGVIMGAGIYINIRNHKLLKNAELRLQPNSSGITFYF